ncbi:hypothetical protein AN958_05640 [Leucoagaricus sp. SymC.cos]|nr:hypothetical protein AN958_05640 [Leucoagaricus sp. SymC.cos]
MQHFHSPLTREVQLEETNTEAHRVRGDACCVSEGLAKCVAISITKRHTKSLTLGDQAQIAFWSYCKGSKNKK